MELRIINYHRFNYDNAPWMLDRQCQFLRSEYDVISMDQVPLAASTKMSKWMKPLAVTVDDGHKDFYDVAMPVFKKHNIPAMCYLVTDFIDCCDWLWFDKVSFLFSRSPKQDFRYALPDGSETHLSMRNPRERRIAARRLKEAFKALPYELFLRALEGLPDTMEVDLPVQAPVEYAPLSWAQILEMVRCGIQFGGHTRTHPVLSRMRTTREWSEEIRMSRARIEKKLESPVLHFAYPNGRSVDIPGECHRFLREEGFRTAVTTIHGLNEGDENLLQLKRICVEPFLEMPVFVDQVAGLDVL